MLLLRNAQEIELIRVASQAVLEIHLVVSELIQPGITTLDLERKILEMMEHLDVIPAYKGYRGFPSAAFMDVNNGVCHSPPSQRKLRAGDIVKVGIGVVKKGYHADKTVTYGVGKINDQAARLIATANEAMWHTISQCRPRNRVFNISHSIQTTAESAGYSVVRDFVGHGIGTSHHEEPQIPNFVPPNAGPGPHLKKGMVLTQVQQIYVHIPIKINNLGHFRPIFSALHFSHDFGSMRHNFYFRDYGSQSF